MGNLSFFHLLHHYSLQFVKSETKSKGSPNSSVATITIIPAVPQALNEFHVTDDLYSTFLVSIWELGEGIGPFLVAPLSERYGRLPVYHTGNVLFLSCSIASALSMNISMLVAFRFLNGLVITSLTLGPTIIADLFKKEERGLAMALAITFQLVGPVAAPIIGSFTAQAKGWRWTIWIITISVGALTSLSILLFRETYQVKILQRRTLHLQETTTNNRLRSKHHSTTSKDSFIKSIKRPLKLLFFSPVVFIVSWVTALTYGLSYLIITTLTETMEKSYGFGQGIVGLSFLGLGMFQIFDVRRLLKLYSSRESGWNSALRCHIRSLYSTQASSRRCIKT